MATFTVPNSNQSVNMLDEDQFVFQQQDMTGLNSSTRFAWTTPDGTAVQAWGTGITFSGGVATGGTVERLEVDLGANDPANPNYVVTGLSADLVTMTGSTAGFLSEVLGADDIILGPNASSTLKGGGGDDSIDGTDGGRLVLGGDGNDTITGSNSIVTLEGGAGDDMITTGNGFSTAFGDAGNDIMFSGNGFTTLNGGDGNDQLTGGGGPGELNGGAGNDTLFERNLDDMFGGDGDDVFVMGTSYRPSSDGYIRDGGNGNDTFDISVGGRSGTHIDLINQRWEQSFASPDFNTFTSIESATGGDGRDRMTGNSVSNTLIGNGGDDTLLGNGGADVLQGGWGDDIIEGGAGNDFVQIFLDDLSNGVDTIDGGGGRDMIELMSQGTFDLSVFDITSMEGLAFNDDIAAGTTMLVASTTQTGLFAGNYHINGNNTAGSADGLRVTDARSFDMSSWTFTQFDNITGDDLAIEVVGTGGNDTLGGSVMTDSLEGGNGADEFDARISTYATGADTLSGGGGTDTLVLREAGTYATNSDIVFDSIEVLRFGSAGGTLLELDLSNITGAGALDANLAVEGSVGIDIIRTDIAASETLNLSSWTFTGMTNSQDHMQFLNGDGTDANLITTNLTDYIDVGFGDNYVNAIAGDDTIIAGGGDDTIFGGIGHDSISTSAGNDVLDGGSDNDAIYSGAGDDTVFGGLGGDVVVAGQGNDSVEGGEGNDYILAEAGADIVSGDAGRDRIFGGSGFDTLMGGDGDDEIEGGLDNDVLGGGDGNDEIVGDSGSDTITGDAGNDLLSGNGGFDSLSGGAGDDTVSGGQGLDFVAGGGGNDSLLGGEGSDTVIGNDGNDTILGQAGNDRLIGAIGDDNLRGGGNNDTIIGGSGNDTMRGDAGADDFVFMDNSGVDVITDFLVNVDDLDVRALGAIGNFADFSAAASNVGADLVITLGGGDQITLLGVQEAQMDANDFIF